jgi:two-component system, NtrC family, sensor kinase
VLKVISRSTFDLQTVFDTLVESAAQLCQANFAMIFRRDGEIYRLAANHGFTSEYRGWVEPQSITIGPGTLVGRTAIEGRTIQIPDALADPEYMWSESISRGGFRTMLGVPLLRECQHIGVIALCRSAVEPFTDKQIELVETFADQAVIAIENVRLFEEVQARTRDLSESLQQQTATADVLKVISRSTFDLQTVLNTLVESAARLCEADMASINREKDDAYQQVASYGHSPELQAYMASHPIPAGDGSVVGRTIKQGRAIHIHDVLADPAYEMKDAAKLGGVQTMLGVPLLREGAPTGVLLLQRKAVRPFTEQQIELLSTFADQAVIAIENTRLFEAEQQRTRELTESLEQQTATSEVLQVISSSRGDLEPVFVTMLENAVRICGATFGTMLLFEGEQMRRVAMHNAPPAYAEYAAKKPVVHYTVSALIRRSWKTKQPVHSADILMEDADDPLAKFAGARSVVSVPMFKDDALIGVIGIFRQEVRPFIDKQIELVQNFAAQAVIAIENARLLNELRQRTDELGRSVGELRALGEVSQAVNSTLDLETVLSTIVAKAVQLSGTEAGAIYVTNELQREFRLRATYGMDQELIEALTQQHIGFDDPNITPGFLEGDAIQMPDLREGVSSVVNEIVLRAGFRALLVTPLLRGKEIVGMLVVRRRTPGAFPQNTVDLIKTFAAQSAVAIQNARLFENVDTRTRELARSLEDLRTAQDRLIQTEKLASLGQLTAGIAHEIKNPLNFVNNFSAVSVELIDELREALKGVHLDSKLRAEIAGIAEMLQGNLDKVVQHGKRADAIVKNMLLHSRQGSGEHRPVDINALVEESLNLAYHGARAEKQGFNITLEKSFDPAVGEADLFPQEITRALLNLISNGFYAATKRKVEADGGDYEPTLAAATKNLGDRVEIRIRDNGTGIPPEVREKLFNPFFTTKPAGEGTGLGLSISHDIIVKQHGGSIEVDTRPGEFTEFRIVLPRAGAALIKSGEHA